MHTDFADKSNFKKSGALAANIAAVRLNLPQLLKSYYECLLDPGSLTSS